MPTSWRCTSASAASAGIPLLPADINESELRFTVEIGTGVRFGLTAIKNVGEGAIESLLEVRKTRGPIASLHALCEDLDLRLVNKRVLREPRQGRRVRLAGAEATRRWSRCRRPSCARGSSRRSTQRASTVRAISGTRMKARRTCLAPLTTAPAPSRPGSAGNGRRSVPLPEATPWTETEQLAFEKETLGLYWSGHPVDRYSVELEALGARSTSELADMPVSVPRTDAWGPGGPKPIEPDTTIGGIVAACRQLKTRKGDRMAVFTLEDADGGIEVIVFPETYQRSAALIETGTMVLVRGKLERDDETVRILASEIVGIDSVRERSAREVAIRLKKPAGRGIFEALGEVFARHRGDRRVSFEIELPSTPTPLRVKADLSAHIRVKPSPTLIAELEQIVGPGRCRCDVASRRREDRLVDQGVCVLRELRDFVIERLTNHGDRNTGVRGTDRRRAEGNRRPRPVAAYRRARSADRDAASARSQTVRAELYASLTPWQRVLVARHPARPCLEQFVNLLFTGFVEIHGDRRFADDHAIMTGFARVQGTAGPARRPREGRRHEGEDLPQLRLRAAGGLPQGAARDAAGGEIPAPRHRVRRHARGVSGDRVGGARRRRGHRGQPARDDDARHAGRRHRQRRRAAAAARSASRSAIAC